jgi:hypothetical protein
MGNLQYQDKNEGRKVKSSLLRGDYTQFCGEIFLDGRWLIWYISYTLGYAKPVDFRPFGSRNVRSPFRTKDTEQQSTATTAGVVCFGDKAFALCVRLMLDFQTKEVISSHKGPGQT